MLRLVLLAVATLAVLPSGARASVTPVKSRGALASPLAELAKPEVRSAGRAERARRLSLPPSGAGSLVSRGADVVVDVRAETTSAPQVVRLREAGARVLHVAAELRTITAAVAPAELRAVAAVPGVENVSPELLPETAAEGAVATCQGSVVSEADTQLRAAPARDDFGVSGAGVTVGVLSDSYDANAADARNAVDGVASGDLPGEGNPCDQTGPVEVVAEGPPEGTDEGRGMLELVHDVAPGASLAFASAIPQTAFPSRIAALRDAGADVLVDDITYFDEPFFQQGPADAAIDQARSAGTAYFTSAGNFNAVAGGQNRSSWEAPGWRSTTCPGGLPDGYTACMNFAAAAGTPNNQLAIGVAPGARLRFAFQWAEPWFGVDSDLDIFLVSGSTIVAASGLQNNGLDGTQKPFEFMSWLNSGTSQANVSVVIARYGTTPAPERMKAILGGGAAVIGTTAPEDRYGPTIIGHNGAPGALSVAAVPYSDANQIETFSSRGPVTHYFGPVSGDVPAAALSTPQALAKPDIAATDGVFTSFFPGNGGSRFFGTSAAAPHAAAVAALQLEAEPDATVAQVYDTQRSTARTVGNFGADARGAGLLDAYAAIDRISQGPPLAMGAAATGVTSAAATLAGVVNPHRLATTIRFEYATAGGATTSTPNQSIGSGKANVAVSATVTGLLPNATYTYRVVAANSAGTSRGEDRAFTAASVPPLAATGAAGAVTTTGATVAGTANPQGTASRAQFEYGPSAAYGASTGEQVIGSGRAPVDLTAALSNLEPATTYHYRVVATSAAGVTFGPDRAFITTKPAVVTPPPVRPIVTPPAASPARPQRMIVLSLTGRTLQITGAGDVSQATVKVRKGKRTLATKRLRLQSGASKVRLRSSDVRSGRAVTIALGGSTVRLDLKARRIRLTIGGGFTRASMHVERRTKPLADGTLQAPARALTLRLQKPRQARSDRIAITLG